MARRPAKPDPARAAVEAGWETAYRHPALSGLSVRHHPAMDGFLAKGELVRFHQGSILFHPKARAEPAEWAWAFAHLLLHIGFGHLRQDRADPGDLRPGREPGDRDLHYVPSDAYRAACCAVVDRFLIGLKLGRPAVPPPSPVEGDERTLAERWNRLGVPVEHRRDGPLEYRVLPTARFEHWDPEEEFALGLAHAADLALQAAGDRQPVGEEKRAKGPWDRALGWFVSSFPLLGALATGMKVVADAEIAQGWGISIAAVDAAAGEIYVNPLRGLSTGEWRFVLAHEMLHAALRHTDRTGGRDPFLWNCACDYVVNGWLVEMAVGEMPEGLLYDPALKGMSGEAVYDRLATDLRRARRLATLRGQGKGDLLDEPVRPERRYVDLDEYYRNALATGLAYHRSSGRGLVPAGLEQEIRALEHPPLPWDARLARWFDERFPAAERARSYARPSRRQASTPDIPRPGWYRPEETDRRRTFGVVLDTSGSMDREMLGKALGAIASFAVSRDVDRARVVFCDAAAYDAGYLHVEEIARKVRVRGRGGTVLQPGVTLLERAGDFPPDGPVLLITDGRCDVVRVRRDHAFLVPAGAPLPFTPRGPVFRMS